MKTILLIRPPMKFLTNRVVDMIDLPLGLLYIAGSLEKYGYNVALIDGVMPEGDYRLDTCQKAENYFGITFEEMERRIRAFDFDIACISAQYTVQFPNAVKMGELLKGINPGCKVLVGGAHVSVCHREIMAEHRCFDVAVRGEGEYAIIDTVKALHGGELAKVKGITYRDGDEVISNEDREYIKELDNLPFPAYYHVDIERYFHLNKRFASRTAYTFPGWERGVSLITSRGCPYDCNFCSIHLHMGRKWRYHSPGYVLRHMDFLIERYGVKYFHFEDDNLTASPKRFERVLDGIIEKGWRIRWDTPNGVRADTFNLELLKKCRETGCTFLIFGIESGVQRVLDEVIHKRIRIEDIERVVRLAQKAGVNTRAFYMIGNPGETRQEIEATVSHALKMIKEYDCFGGIAMAVPLYGTRLLDDCIRNKYLLKEMTPEDITAGYTFGGMIKTEEFAPDFLKRMLEFYDKRTTALLKWVFLKRVLTDWRLFLYCVKTIFKMPPSRWGSAYYKVIFSHHALTWDMENGVP